MRCDRGPVAIRTTPNWSSALRFMERLLPYFECIGTMNPDWLVAADVCRLKLLQ